MTTLNVALFIYHEIKKNITIHVDSTALRGYLLVAEDHGTSVLNQGGK